MTRFADENQTIDCWSFPMQHLFKDRQLWICPFPSFIANFKVIAGYDSVNHLVTIISSRRLSSRPILHDH